uniref:Uncharacterized protein n=1 Tax=Romanomermis culicivorax TaxID=13658 RepID=A0A915KQW5_ROMCU
MDLLQRIHVDPNTMQKKRAMLNETNETLDCHPSIDLLSHTFLQVQRPGYILCIICCIIDILSCILVLLVANYPINIGVSFYFKCDMVSELISSMVYAISNFVHLYNSLMDHSEF